MGRYSNMGPGKGLSQCALPYRHSVPTWLKLMSGDVKEQIYKLAKKDLTPSQMVLSSQRTMECAFPLVLDNTLS
uniref:Small ribosomal subunit protein uS15 N-terminal domain-containing protein n=1 Tax=Sus scrofa TaxID=9823 RepID=A0A8D1Q0F4_PIG